MKAAAIKAKELCASKATDLARIAIKHWLKWVAPQLHGLTLVVSVISGRYVGHVVPWHRLVQLKPMGGRCRTPGVNVFLMGMATPAEVTSNLLHIAIAT